MTTRLFLTLALAAGIPAFAAAQNPDNPPQADPQVSGPAQLTDVQSGSPQGYLDPNFANKPHAGTPLPSDGSATAAPPPSSPNQAPNWYKDSPQAYDHGASKPRHLRAPKNRPQVYDDTQSEPAPSSEVAQENPPEQPQELPPAQSDDEPTPQVQPLPRYYGGQSSQQQYDQQQYQDQQAYAGQPQQNYQQPQDYAYQGEPDYPQDDYGSGAVQPTQQPLGAEQLEQLVAPIALYPDQLVAQILTASTYPAQITAADQFVRSMNGAQPEQIAQGANAQTGWDPSVKALTAFPQVLAMLDGNLQWTAALGNAYYNQPQDVLETIQLLRQRAQQDGNLQSTAQQQVIQQPNYIQIEPTNPEYVYVPSYNPWYVYGAPIAPYPSFEFGDWGLYIGGGIGWGLRFAVAPFFNFGFGFGYWGLDWARGGCLYNHGYYWSHSHEVRDWGFAHGGRRWDGGRSGWNHGGYGGRDYARFGNYNHEPMNIHGAPGPRSGGHSFFGGSQQELHRMQPARPMQGYGHMQGGFTRPQSPGQQAFSHLPPANGRPEQFRGRTQPYGGQPFSGRQPLAGGPQPFRGGSPGFGGRNEPYSRPQPVAPSPRPGNGFGGYPRPNQGYMGRPAPLQTYRGPQQSYSAPRPFGGGSSGFGQSYARPQQPSNHSFFGGGGRSAPSFGGGGHSFGGGSHSFGGGPSFGGGSHSFGGGGGHSFGGGGGHSFGGGGGHSFGGGGHSFGGGGGHSFGGGGGHSFGGGGHSSGGGHHR
ncbi:DUF3300 domain-containing protein [Occallatibacter riparius]|uniref:DUF3300 domain-containing protein n=1 Tax=Occallatibacter riparius TaxID=1002689 RepID=UPI0021B1CE78|nr:DUF3300 domain-containing protein [Occallatibacter riparius]